MKLTGAQIICESMLKEGVDVVFGLPGGTVIPFYDTLGQYEKQIHHVLVRHEQCAAHAADGYARVTGKVGVCIATSGPGATNLVTGIANAYLDSAPIVALTGQVNRALIGKDAFQEIDITGVTLPITKHNYLVPDAESLPHILKEAFHIARTGRPGPVLVDVPRDVFTGKAEFQHPDKVSLPSYKPNLPGHPAQIKKAAKLINEARRPLIIAGRGIIISQAYAELRSLAETAQIPLLTTLLGVGGFPESHVLSYGWLGMHGMAYANMAVNECDLIIAIGMRFDDRATGRVSGFAPQANIIHIDIDPAEIGKNVRVDVPIVGNAKDVLASLLKQLAPATHTEWLARLDQLRREHPFQVDREATHILPQYVIGQLYEITRGEAIIVTGVGQHQMWAAQHYWFDKPNCLVTSGGLGTMGFGLPASVGVKIGRPQETVWCIDGDGSFQMTMHELATITQEHLAIKIAILNNGYLGMVRQWQDLFYAKHYVATPLTCPDFMKIAEAYCIPHRRVERREDVAAAIREANDTPGPFLMEFAIEPEENVYPMVPGGAQLSETIEGPKKEVGAWPRRITP